MTKSGLDIARDARARRTQLKDLALGERGLDRGVISALPLEEIVIGKDAFVAIVDVGHLPFVLAGLAVQARDDAAGVLSVGLYRVDRDAVLPNGWTARRSGAVDIVVSAGPQEVCGELDNARELDRTAAAWLVAVRGSTDTMIVRGTSAYTPPSFAGWTIGNVAALPATISSDDLDWTLAVPAVAVLTQAGLRLRGTGTIAT